MTIQPKPFIHIPPSLFPESDSYSELDSPVSEGGNYSENNYSDIGKRIWYGDSIGAIALIKSDKTFDLFENGQNILRLAIQICPNLELIQLLLVFYRKTDSSSVGAIDHVDRSNKTPLMDACLRGNIDIVNLLIEAGAVVDMRNSCLQTALHKLARIGWFYNINPKTHIEIARILIMNGAYIGIIDNEGFTPLEACVNGDSPEKLNFELISYLISENADPSTRTYESSPELNRKIHLAIIKGFQLRNLKKERVKARLEIDLPNQLKQLILDYV